MLTMFAAFSEFEREVMLERQREGIAIAKREGKNKGRKPLAVSDRFFTVAKAWSEGNLALKATLEEAGMSASAFFRKYKKYGIKKVA